MARFNYQSWNSGETISPTVGALPYTEIDQDSLVYNNQRLAFNAAVYDPITGRHDGQYILYGSFNGFFTPRFLKSRITGVNVAFQDLGSASITEFNVQASISQGDPSAFAQALMAGNDSINATAFDDAIDLFTGNDTVYAGQGNDTMQDTRGVNTFYGEGGIDTYIFAPGAPAVWVRDSIGTRPNYILATREAKPRKGRRKGGRTEYLIDRDFNILQDFNANEDILDFSGDPNSYTYDVVGGGIGFFYNETDFVGWMPGLTEARYIQGINEV